jgi:RNA polymerase sigma factor (sigma-70 family)
MSELLETADADAPAAERAARSAVPPIRPTDAERLMRFWRRRDQAALEELIERHAGMVWGVCSQVLRRREDVEDAFQATFLILARKAKTIRAADSVAGWLYRVAFRTALLAHNRRRRLAEAPLPYEPMARAEDQLEAIARNEQCRVLLEELHALPLQYREPLVLCYLEGRSRSEAADELGVTPQSVKGRLARGTRLLRSRMVSRGAVLSTTMTVVAASMSSAQAAATPALVSSTAALGASFAMKLAGAKGVSAQATAAVLAEKGILSMTLVAAAKPAVAVLAVCLAAGMFAVATAEGPGDAGGGAGVALLADGDADGDELGTGGGEVDVAVSAGDESDNFDDPQRDETTNDLQQEPQSIVNEGKWTLVPAAAPGAPAAPAAPIAPPLPAGLPMTVNAGGEAPVIAALPGGAAPDVREFKYHVEHANHPMAVSLPRFPLAGGSSEAALKLEQEYWALKADALKMKAEAIMSKANSLEESGAGSQTEVLAARADAELALAEVKLCELNSLKVKEQLEAAEAGKLKVGSKGVHVRMLQELLNARVEPSPKLDVDGDFGPLTEQAVRQLQKTNGLEPTGVFDEQTAMAVGMPSSAARDFLQISPNADLLYRNAPIEIRKHIENNVPQSELRASRIVVGGGAGGAAVTAGGAPAKVRVQFEKAMAIAKEAAAKQAEASQRKAQSAERQAQNEALRAQAESMRHAIKELEKRLEEAERQAEEAERQEE